MTKLAPEWVRTSDPVIRSPVRYRWTTAPADYGKEEYDVISRQSIGSMYPASYGSYRWVALLSSMIDWLLVIWGMIIKIVTTKYQSLVIHSWSNLYYQSLMIHIWSNQWYQILVIHLWKWWCLRPTLCKFLRLNWAIVIHLWSNLNISQPWTQINHHMICYEVNGFGVVEGTPPPPPLAIFKLMVWNTISPHNWTHWPSREQPARHTYTPPPYVTIQGAAW